MKKIKQNIILNDIVTDIQLDDDGYISFPDNVEVDLEAFMHQLKATLVNHKNLINISGATLCILQNLPHTIH